MAGLGRIPAVLVPLVLLVAGCGAVPGRTDAAPAVTVDDGSDTTAIIEVLDAPEPEAPPTVASGDGDGGDGHGGDGSDGNSGADGKYTIVAQATVAAVVARSEPDPAAAPIAEFTNPTASGSPLVFRAVDASGRGSSDWIEVQLPIQPNGSTGWIPRADVALSDNPYRVEIDRSDYSLRVLHLNNVWMETSIAVGTGETPTPVGEFYLMELLSPPDPGGPYGPFAFGLSGFSEVLTSFGGADEAIIGLHGTNDPGSLGTDVSHGCIRLANEVIEQLAEVLPLGTPVRIT